MFYRKFFALMVAYILLLNFARSDELLKNNDHVLENVEEPPDIKRRKAIAEEYFHKSSPQVIENWIDPHDPFRSVIEQHLKSSIEKKDHQCEVRLEPINLPKEPNRVSNEQTKIPPLSSSDNEEHSYIVDAQRYVNVEKTYVPEEKITSHHVEPSESSMDDEKICVSHSIYISRWLNKLVSKIEKESNLEASAINFPIDSIMFNNLKELTTVKSFEISQLDELVCKIIDQSSIIGIDYFGWIILYDSAKYLVGPIIIFVLVAISLYAIYQSITATIFCCIAVSGVFWYWMQLYELLFEPSSTSSRYLTLFTIIPIFIFSYMVLVMLLNNRIIFDFGRNIPHAGDHVQQFKSNKPLKLLNDTVECKFPSIKEETCMQKSPIQDADIHVGKVLKQSKNPKLIENVSEETSVHSKMKHFTSGPLSIPPSSSVLEQSDIDDDISIIGSDESCDDTENSFMGQNLVKQSMDDSFHFSPEGYDSLS